MESTLAGRQLGSCPFLNSLSIYLTAQHVGILNLTHFEHPGIILWCLASYVGNSTYSSIQSSQWVEVPARLRVLTARACHLTSPSSSCTDEEQSQRLVWSTGWLGMGFQVPLLLGPRARLCQISLSLSSSPADGVGRGEHSLHLCIRNHYAVTFSFPLELVPFSWVMAIYFQIICLSH